MVSEVTEAFFCWHSKQFFAEIDLQASHQAQDSPNATLPSFSSEHKTCFSHWIFLSTIKPEATTNQVSGKVVTDPAGRRVSHNSGRKKNTTLDCGAVALRLELFSKSFFRVAGRTWLPRHWKRSDRDHKYWHTWQCYWDAIRHRTRRQRLLSRTLPFLMLLAFGASSQTEGAVS